jgi:hypothetical protein
MKKKFTNILLTIIAVLSLFNLSLIANGQEKNSAGARSEFSYVDPGTEPVSGYWEYSGSKTSIFSADKFTEWVKDNNVLEATCKWLDVLKIEHTVSSSFKWEDPPTKLLPGSDIKMSGNYINNEYSTTNKVITGFRVLVNKSSDASTYISSTNIEVIKVLKDNKQHVSEAKTGYFVAPKFFQGDNREMQVIVDCYVGKDHYLMTYTYVWVDSSPL